MAGKTCSQCGAPVDVRDDKCPYCGSVIEGAAPPPAAQTPAAPSLFPTYPAQQTAQQNYINSDGINMSWPIKSKTAAAVLAILLGTFGVHKFYLGKTGQGIVYLILTCTGALAPIVALVSIIEGVSYLVQNDHNFQVKNQVRLR